MRAYRFIRIPRVSVLCLTGALVMLGVALTPSIALATAPPGYSEITVREIGYGTGPTSILVQQAEEEGKRGFGPAAFAVDASGNWYFPDPRHTSRPGMREGEIKVFPSNGSVRPITCHVEVDDQTELDVTDSGTLVVAPTSDYYCGVVGNVISVIPPLGDEYLMFVGSEEPGPRDAVGSSPTLHIRVQPPSREAQPLSETFLGPQDIFPQLAKTGASVGFSVKGLCEMRGEHHLTVDPQGAVYVMVGCLTLGGDAADRASLRELCRLDLGGKLASVMPGNLDLNRQGRLLLALPGRPRAGKRQQPGLPCELRLCASSGQVENVVELGIPQTGPPSGDSYDFFPRASRVYFDGAGRIYVGPLGRSDSPDQFFVHIYAPDGEYLGSGSWPKGTVNVGCTRQIEVDKAGNVYFVQFGESSMKLMKWIRQ
jgi:hypothetical protein